MSSDDLRWKLRQLPREREPSRDLWPAIAAAIGAPGSRFVNQPQPAASRWLRWTSAIAAALVLTSVKWSLARPGLLHSVLPSRRNSEHVLVLQEADAIRNNYQAALSQYRGAPVP